MIALYISWISYAFICHSLLPPFHNTFCLYVYLRVCMRAILILDPHAQGFQTINKLNTMHTNSMFLVRFEILWMIQPNKTQIEIPPHFAPFRNSRIYISSQRSFEWQNISFAQFKWSAVNFSFYWWIECTMMEIGNTKRQQRNNSTFLIGIILIPACTKRICPVV